MKRLTTLILPLLLALNLTACGDDFAPAVIATTPQLAQSTSAQPEDVSLPGLSQADGSDISGWETDLPQEGEYYYDLENVVLYLELYDALPDNFITKSEARDLGWNGGSVEEYLEGAAIGGDQFGNREELLPKEPGRTYTECDLNTDGAGSRGAERLVFSNDGLYFYTQDHYESFTEYVVTEDWTVEEG